MKLSWRLIILLCIFASPVAHAADSLSDFYASLRTVFAKHYPTATVTARDQSMTFEHDTRIFLIHDAFKTGEWQDATEQRGPKKSGIYCQIVAQSGPYKGAAAVPQTFDKRYFSVLLLAPYSKRLNHHLHVRLSYPAGASKEFLQEFAEAINTFEGY